MKVFRRRLEPPYPLNIIIIALGKVALYPPTDKRSFVHSTRLFFSFLFLTPPPLFESPLSTPPLSWLYATSYTCYKYRLFFNNSLEKDVCFSVIILFKRSAFTTVPLILAGLKVKCSASMLNYMNKVNY